MKDKKISGEEIISFLPPIQVGYEIYYENLEIEEIQDRQNTVWQFIQGSNQQLDWEQEPSNPQDPYAIKIFGISEQVFSTKQELLGYVPRSSSKHIVTSGLWPFLQLRLECVYVTNQGFLAIKFQILGPIRKKSADKNQERSLIGKEKKELKSSAPKFQTARKVEEDNKYFIFIKRMLFLSVRMMTIAIGMAFAFIGGKMGTAAWQASENFFSTMMLVPIALVMSGGILIWMGIKPSKHKSSDLDHSPGDH